MKTIKIALQIHIVMMLMVTCYKKQETPTIPHIGWQTGGKRRNGVG
ncbi:MAG: hypothetical protein K5895_02535 [Lachnospiraceae bacterium]|nr:hypothetical protein [Lachnospiraceae bacterium]